MTRAVARTLEIKPDELLARLAEPPVAWPLDRLSQWSKSIAGAKVFARRWDAAARANGWGALQLYGLHEVAPWHNLAAAGAAFIAGDMAIAVTAESVLMVTRTGSRLRIYRRPPDPSSILAWDFSRAKRI